MKMVQELDVAKMVGCPRENGDSVNIDEQCPFCEFYHGTSYNDSTLKCGFEDNEKNEDAME